MYSRRLPAFQLAELRSSESRSGPAVVVLRCCLEESQQEDYGAFFWKNKKQEVKYPFGGRVGLYAAFCD